ncbi:DMT family transporter [Niallia sp. 01092]|uniref:DMT family transporter n=1 Tax=unclassified Niallia TaxID=2837522 RepID=UPI003FD1BB6B
MAWIALMIAGLCEVAGVLNIKRLTQKKWDAVIFLVLGFVLSFGMLTYALKTIPMGTAYGIWTGIGTIGSACIGMFLYNEPKDWKRLLFISMILAASIGLKIIS